MSAAAWRLLNAEINRGLDDPKINQTFTEMGVLILRGSPEDFGKMIADEARCEFFSGDFPTATVVQVVALADPAYKVEIEAIAHIGAGGT
jgi:hypothetical protein